MPVIKPFFSERQIGRTDAVFHNSSACAEGSSIPFRHRQEGTGGRRQCVECARLNSLEFAERLRAMYPPTPSAA
jgi:hypothetical protein